MSTDLDKLQGTWHITSLEADGQEMPEVAFDGATIIINEQEFKSLGMGAEYEGTIEIDQTQKPKTLDLVFTVGHAAGTRNPGIYKLVKDRWTICLATRGIKRPLTFATKPGSGHALETLKRRVIAGKSKKEKAKPIHTKSAKPAAAKLKPSRATTELEGEWSMVAGVFSGVAMKQDMIKWVKRITQGNLTSVVAGPQVMLMATFTLVHAQHPQGIDYENREGVNAGKAQSGIFALSGDTLKICMAASGKPRPTNFSSKSGDGRSYTTWRLIKK
jgi:uncharacterized protein (TIGR03067 family)